MSNATHETAPTEFVQVGGVRFAYRRFGRPGGLPLPLLNYLAATLDDWDPPARLPKTLSASTIGSAPPTPLNTIDQ